MGAPDALFPHPRNSKSTFFRKSAKIEKKTRVFAATPSFRSKRGSLDFRRPPNRLPKTKKNGKKLARENYPRSVFAKDDFLEKNVFFLVFCCVSHTKMSFERVCFFTFFTFPTEGRVTFRRQKTRKTHKLKKTETVTI